MLILLIFHDFLFRNKNMTKETHFLLEHLLGNRFSKQYHEQFGGNQENLTVAAIYFLYIY